MKTLELETKDAGYFKFAAMRDARMKSYAASTHYTEAQKIQAERIKLALGLVYKAKEIYVTFRKKFVVIKVDGPQFIRDKQSLTLLEKDYEKLGIQKVATAQGIAYRIIKA